MTAILHRRTQANPAGYMYGMTRRDLMAASALGLLAGAPRLARAAPPAGQLTWALHVSVPPTWFDPADTQAIISPYMILYALHDAMVKPMPGISQAPSLAESWQASEDGLTWEFTIRDGVKFHNGAPVTGEDVKFSFERYRGANQTLLQQKVAAVEAPDARHVRFKLKEAWPDFLTFYSSASGSGWVVPKKYVEEVGDEGFKKAPIGAGPYKFVSYDPGVGLVLEAFDGYWRKTPAVKTLVMKVVPDESTRLAALKGGEVDIAYSIRGDLARELEKTPGLSLKSVVLQATNWIYFPEQWNPKSPWHKLQVRQAANLALDRKGWNDALFLGGCNINNSIIPHTFDYYWQPPAAVYDPAKARKLLAEAGYPNGFDAGPFWIDASYANIGEVAVNSLQQVGIRLHLQPLERAGFLSSFANKKFDRGILRGASGAFGNAATRLASFVVKGGSFVYGSYPDIDELFVKQATELDPKKREEILHRIQQLVHEKAIDAPIWELAFINGVGPRLGESSFGRIGGFPYTAPFEDLTIQKG
ncbi:MAG: ABC transporter substrate-binding protein [Alphaproteobacteria bacterium]